MAVSVDNQTGDGGSFVTFDSADASGTEEILAAITGKQYVIHGFIYSCAVAGESTLDLGNHSLILQLPANGGVSAPTLPYPLVGTLNAAVNYTSPAGGASGILFYSTE